MMDLFLKRAFFSLFLIIFCFFSNSVLAANGNYQIEMIVFSRLTPQTLNSEQWPILSPDLSKPTLSNNSEPQLSRSQLTLNDASNSITREPGYRIVTHLAWQEHLTDATQHFVLSNGNLYDSRGNLISKNFSNATHMNPEDYSPLNGNFSITLGHYIDTKLNLYLIEPTAMLKRLDANGYFNHISNPTFAFALSESRRMRSQELNYFWHPVMGVLIKITPIADIQTKA